MRNSEIKTLFLKADEQIPVNEVKKQQTYEMMTMEIDKRKILIMPKQSILLSLFGYIDKLFFIIYGVLICLGLVFILALHHTGVGKNEMIIVCMIGAGLLSMISIGLIDKLFFGRMAELVATCYFSTKRCIAAYLVLAGVINLVILIFKALYLDCYWKVGLLQVGVYVLTPYLISNMIALGILSTEKVGRTSYSLGICAVFLSIGYVVIGSIPSAFLPVELWIWVIAFVMSGILFALQLKKFFKQMEKGELLCMS